MAANKGFMANYSRKMRRSYIPAQKVELSPKLEEAVANGDMTRDQAEARLASRHQEIEVPRISARAGQAFQQFMAELGIEDTPVDISTKEIEVENKAAIAHAKDWFPRHEDWRGLKPRSWKAHRKSQFHS